MPLTTEPLKIDILVIKKIRDRIIKKNIAEIFRGYNIIEYKSPSDYISVDDFHKVCGYVYLYMSINRVSITDVTLTLLENRHPRELLKYFKQLGVSVEERTPGVYIAQANIFPVQIIESKNLPEEENIWLRNLKRGISAADMERMIRLKSGDYSAIALKAYLYALIMANPESIKRMEADNMGSTTLAEVLKEMGYIQQWVAQGEAQGIAVGEARGIAVGKARGRSEGIFDTLYVIKGLKNNVPIEKLAEESKMSIEDIEKIRMEI